MRASLCPRVPPEDPGMETTAAHQPTTELSTPEWSETRRAVSIGCQVRLGFDDQLSSETLRLVEVASPTSRELELSAHSPVGRAVLGRSVGETVVVATPSGSVRVTIGEIHV